MFRRLLFKYSTAMLQRLRPGDRRSSSTRRTRNYKPYICLAIVCIVAIIFIFGYTIIYFFYQLYSNVSRTGEELYEEVKLRLTNFDDSKRACAVNNSYLPLPKTQEDEDFVISEIHSLVHPDCEFVFFGYKADTSIRYQSLSGAITWASLKVPTDGTLPFDFIECYEIWFLEDESLSVVTVDNCGQRTGQSLLFLTNYDGECLIHRFQCVDIYKSLPRNDVNTSYRLAKEKNPNLFTLLPFDKNNRPESLELQKYFITEPTIVLAVKYKFIYKHGDETQQYVSKRFLVIDPEYDCIAYDIKRDKVVTRSCDDKGCPVCSSR